MLVDTSKVLESLAETAGIQSFILAVDPSTETDAGFLGGSLAGRAYWRDLRGGGEQGAKAFKQYCLKNESKPVQSTSSTHRSVPTMVDGRQPTSGSGKKLDAKTLKADLYETVRKALKSVAFFRLWWHG